jgi:hypothetical protein
MMRDGFPLSLVQRPGVSPTRRLLSPPRPSRPPASPSSSTSTGRSSAPHQAHEKGGKAQKTTRSHCLSVPPSGGSRLQSRELAQAPSHHARACVRPCLRVRRKGAPMPWCIAAGALAPLWLLFFDACTHAAPAPSRASVLRGRTVGAQLQLQLQARAQATAMADASTEVNSCPSAATGYSMGQVVWLQVAGAGYRQPAGQQR